VKTNGDTIQVRLMVRRIVDPEPIRSLYLVTFEPATAAAAALVPAALSPRRRRRTRLAELEQELAYTQAHLQSTVEELEAANEELRASNEEAQSTNEELQSANEELESSREELQSLNEELHTVNAELYDKVEALSQANDEIQNLLNSVNVATLFLDADLRIKRFTTPMTQVVKLIDSDIGRPLSDLASTLNYERLLEDVTEVLHTLVFKEIDVQTKEGMWYLLRIMPYRTIENSIDGLVLTFVDISKLKASEQIAADLRYANNIVQTVREPLLVLDVELRVVSANQAFYRTFHLQVEQVEQRRLYELNQGQWNIPALRQLLQSVSSEDASFVDFEVSHEFADVGYKRLLLNARRLQTHAEQPGLILLAMEDVTNATA
jgi:two-component system CheB/CheR fusion protein